MPKYRDYCREMMDKNEAEFAAFAKVHDKYSLDRHKWQDEFNSKGAGIVEIIREWEGRLCGHSEKGNFGKFSSTLAEKFWGEVKAFFPLIDFVGVKITKPAVRVAVVEKEKVIEPVDPDMKEIDDFDPDDDFVIKKLF